MVYRPENIPPLTSITRDRGQELPLSARRWRFGNNNENLHLNAAMQARNDGADDGDCPCWWCLNCWSVIMSLTPHRQQLPVCGLVPHRHAVSECAECWWSYTDTLERVKWTLCMVSRRDFEQTRTLITNVTESQKRFETPKVIWLSQEQQFYPYEEREQ